MSAFLIESLFPSGWRRTGELYWRYGDALREAHRRLHEDDARGVRVLPVQVGSFPVWESTSADDGEETGVDRESN